MTAGHGGSPVVHRMSCNINTLSVTAIQPSVRRITVFRKREGSVDWEPEPDGDQVGHHNTWWWWGPRRTGSSSSSRTHTTTCWRDGLLATGWSSLLPPTPSTALSGQEKKHWTSQSNSISSLNTNPSSLTSSLPFMELSSARLGNKRNIFLSLFQQSAVNVM